MKIYLVGGAVRDQLLGLPVKEKDYVVVNATVDEMLQLGFRQVGKEFPVFLHPKTNEEYALARMERKVALGYKGFEFDASPNVTLKEDLARRDLTINAMAQDLDGVLNDPYHGQQDLEQKILRHVSKAFVEDPVRILRVGRFYARYAHLGFTIAPETRLLMKEMVAAGEVDALVAERVWKEFERALSEKNPEKFFEVLEECDALAKLFPHLTHDSRGIAALTVATKMTNDASIRFAALMYQTPANNFTILARRFKFPNNYRDLAELTARFYARAFKAQSAEELLDVLTGLDVLRREERFQKFLLTCAAIAQVEKVTFDREKLVAAADVIKKIDVQELISAGIQGADLAVALNKKRLEVLRSWGLK